MMLLALFELPSFEQWEKRGFPFWKSPWIYNFNSAQLFYKGLQDRRLLSEVMKIAAKHSNEYTNKPLHGYFMKCNCHCEDPVNYILTSEISPEGLEKTFQFICEQSGKIFSQP